MSSTALYQWTFMVYMAGDNGALLQGALGKRRLMAAMEDAAEEDLVEMGVVGSSDKVAILVQLDTLSGNRAYRYHISKSGENDLVEEIAEQNTGDPASLRDFIIWGVETYPAHHYAVILWNHGTGWKEDDVYAFARERTLPVHADKSEIRSVFNGDSLAGSLFLTTAAQIIGIEDDDVRGICYDDSSKDFLDNAELKRAFVEAEGQTKRKIDLIGMDACLMSMLEVAYQLRDQAKWMVASQEVEPLCGWPYTAILQALVAEPTMEPATLSALIVRAYGESLPRKATQSAIALDRIAALVPLIQQLAQGLGEAITTDDLLVWRAFHRAQQAAVRFKDPDFVDFYDLLTFFRAECPQDGSHLSQTLDSALHLWHDPQRCPVHANVAHGAGLERAQGLSIYLPDRGCSEYYGALDFAATLWDALIRQLNTVKGASS